MLEILLQFNNIVKRNISKILIIITSVFNMRMRINKYNWIKFFTERQR